MNPKESHTQSPPPGEHSLTRIASSDNGVTLAVAGEIDISNAEEFGEHARALVDGADGEVVLRLRDCSFIDSTGIKALIALGRELQMDGRTLVLSSLNGAPRRVLEIAGLLDETCFAVRDETMETDEKSPALP